MKVQLPNGCSHSTLSVNPRNWHTKGAKVTHDWFIGYRFYDSRHSKPKQVMIKGMNAFKTIQERQQATKHLIEEELKALNNGYNPFLKGVNTIHAEETLSFTFLEALALAFGKISIANITRRDLQFSISQFKGAVKKLGWQNISISEISRKHVREILDASSNSNDRFNKNRSYLMILFSMLCELEVIPINYVRDIKKKKVTKKIREVLTPRQRVIVEEHLKNNYPEFHRFLHIFFHSGARISELMKVRVADVDLANQRFKLLIQKGRNYQEVWKTIKDIALPYWQEVLINSSKEQFVFSVGLKPGDKQIEPYQLNKRWRRLVKKKLGITADFYSLKHLHTTEVVDLLSDIHAARHNNHTSTVMVNTVYDVNSRARKNNLVKGLQNSFVS